MENTPHQGTSTPSTAGGEPTLGVLFSRFSTQITTLVRGEIALAKAQATELATRFIGGIIALVVAGLLGLYLLGWLLLLLTAALSSATGSIFAGLGLTILILVILIAIAAAVGIVLIKKGKNHVPRPQEGVKASVEVLKSAVKKENTDE